MMLQIYECDFCNRPFYVSPGIPDLPRYCCYCGTGQVVNTGTVIVEEPGGYKMELSLTPLGGERRVL